MALTAPVVQQEETTIMRLLDNVPVFAGIGVHEQHLVATKCQKQYVDKEVIVIEQDDLSNNLFIIIQGTVVVSKKIQEHTWAKVNVLGPGDFFGEIAMLRNVPRTARVTTQTPCVFLTINGADFMEVYPFFPPKARDNIQIIVAKRLAELATYGRVNNPLW